MNSFGQYFRVSTFGESHGPAIGAVVEGCPAGLAWDEGFLQAEMARRRPGQSDLVTRRTETDAVEVLSGVFEGRTTGMPIALLVRNEDARTGDYDHLREVFRPSHADYTFWAKYGVHDHRGGGRSSARETAARVAAGAVAKMLLRDSGISVQAYVSQVGEVVLQKNYAELDLSLIDAHPVRCPDPETAQQMETLIKAVRKAGDTVGGVVTGVVKGCPPGLGAPVFDKLQARLAYAMLGINACKGFEYGSGFSGASMRGSGHNDAFFADPQGKIQTKTNYSGGIQGGISNGMDIYFRAAFKPVATIVAEQATVDRHGAQTVVRGKGRHDPCVLPRAVPIVEAMTALVMADLLLAARLDRATP